MGKAGIQQATAAAGSSRKVVGRRTPLVDGLDKVTGRGQYSADLHAPEPEMPPFDASQHEPMPEVEINPPDEFGGEA